MAAPGAAYFPIFGATARATAAGPSTEHTLRVWLCDGLANVLEREQTVLNYEFARWPHLDADERERDDQHGRWKSNPASITENVRVL